MEHLIVDVDKRQIIIPESITHLGVKDDNETRTLNFRMPKIYKGLDMSGYTIEINYINAKGKGDSALAKNIQVGDEEITFQWCAGGTAYAKDGKVRFLVYTYLENEDLTRTNEWHTTWAALEVLDGGNVEEQIAEENPRIIEEMRRRIRDLENGETGGTKDAIQYIEQELTDEQKAQARTNISAASAEDVRQVQEQIADYEGQLANMSVPTKTSQLQNDSNFVTSETTNKLSSDISKNANDIVGIQSELDTLLSARAEGDTLAEQLAWLEENGDKNKKYLCADGYYYECVYTEGKPLYTNRLPLATDLDRQTIYNNGKGYIENHRTKSDGSVVSCTGMSTTGLILDTKLGDIIRIKNATDSTTSYEQSITFYNSSNASLGHSATPKTTTTAGNMTKGMSWNDDLTELTIKTSELPNASEIASFNAFRVSRGDFSNAIITVNEEIVEGTTEGSYNWVNTGQTTPDSANYEDRIATLESKVEKLEENEDSNSTESVNYVNSNIKVISHRGYMNIAPENTLSAFKLSKKMGFDYVECDIAQTSDGVAVLLHDDTVDRTSNGTGNISEMTFEQVRTLDFGSWKSSEYTGEKIPTFEEFLLLCKNLGLHPYIEIKGTATFNQEQIENLVSMVKRNGMRDNVTWIASIQTHLSYIQNVDANARLGLVRSGISDNTISTATTLKNNGTNEIFIDIDAGQATEENLERAINADIPVEVYADDTIDILSLNPYITGYTVDSTDVNKVLYDANI